MKSGWSQFDRRMEIFSILRNTVTVKRNVLAERFSVSLTTINDDLIALNRYAPIRSKTGPYGGIFLSREYHYGREYLSKEERLLLKKCIENSAGENKRLFESILHKFSIQTTDNG